MDLLLSLKLQGPQLRPLVVLRPPKQSSKYRTKAKSAALGKIPKRVGIENPRLMSMTAASLGTDHGPGIQAIGLGHVGRAA